MLAPTYLAPLSPASVLSRNVSPLRTEEPSSSLIHIAAVPYSLLLSGPILALTTLLLTLWKAPASVDPGLFLPVMSLLQVRYMEERSIYLTARLSTSATSL